MTPLFRAAFLAFLLLGSALPAAETASIAGEVALPRRRSAPVLDQRYEIVARGGVLATNPPLAVVYFEPAGAVPPPAAEATAQMAQRNLDFEPALLPVRRGTRVFFPNQDDTYHNIFSYSPAKRFDLGRYRSDERPVPSVVFDTAGLVTLHCDIHQHMRALILVLGTPYFVVTRPDGGYRLDGLPPGPGRLKVWLDSRTTREADVAPAAGATLRRDFP